MRTATMAGTDIVVYDKASNTLTVPEQPGVFGHGSSTTTIDTVLVVDYTEDPAAIIDPRYLLSEVRLTLRNTDHLIPRFQVSTASSAELRALIARLTTMAGHLEALEHVRRDHPRALLESGFREAK